MKRRAKHMENWEWDLEKQKRRNNHSITHFEFPSQWHTSWHDQSSPISLNFHLSLSSCLWNQLQLVQQVGSMTFFPPARSSCVALWATSHDFFNIFSHVMPPIVLIHCIQCSFNSKTSSMNISMNLFNQSSLEHFRDDELQLTIEWILVLILVINHSFNQHTLVRVNLNKHWYYLIPQCFQQFLTPHIPFLFFNKICAFKTSVTIIQLLFFQFLSIIPLFIKVINHCFVQNTISSLPW